MLSGFVIETMQNALPLVSKAFLVAYVILATKLALIWQQRRIHIKPYKIMRHFNKSKPNLLVL